jgi:phage baseplate assembly protein W
MQTFAIVNGDIRMSSGSYAVVTGEAKLRQDLSFALREPMGIDRFHPRWGSTLSEMVGEAVSERSSAAVEAEARRVVETYARVQADRLNTDATNRQVSRFSTGEVIRSIDSVQVRQEYDRLHLRIALTTMSRAEVVLMTTVRI